MSRKETLHGSGSETPALAMRTRRLHRHGTAILGWARPSLEPSTTGARPSSKSPAYPARPAARPRSGMAPAGSDWMAWADAATASAPPHIPPDGSPIPNSGAGTHRGQHADAIEIGSREKGSALPRSSSRRRRPDGSLARLGRRRRPRRITLWRRRRRRCRRGAHGGAGGLGPDRDAANRRPLRGPRARRRGVHAGAAAMLLLTGLGPLRDLRRALPATEQSGGEPAAPHQ